MILPGEGLAMWRAWLPCISHTCILANDYTRDSSMCDHIFVDCKKWWECSFRVTTRWSGMGEEGKVGFCWLSRSKILFSENMGDSLSALARDTPTGPAPEITTSYVFLLLNLFSCL